MRRIGVVFTVLAGVLGACIGAPADEQDDGQDPDPAPAATDLPCDVAPVLATCTGCHATENPSGGVRIASAADLAAPAPGYPGSTVADRSLARMQDGSMPPGAPLDAASVAAFDAWIAAGMPVGDCGVGGGAPIEIVCTSQAYWTKGDEGSEDMHPGMACVSCHAEPNDEGETGPGLLFGGTVYPTAHEPDDCRGIGPVTVVVTDAAGRTVQATARGSGNFFVEGESPLVLPIRAEVRRDGKTLAMQDPVDSVDCNACHTAEGAEGAPGRIVAP